MGKWTLLAWSDMDYAVLNAPVLDEEVCADVDCEVRQRNGALIL